MIGKDGRRRAPQLLPRQPAKIRNSGVREIIKAFNATGQSVHSKNATMLQYLIDYCEENHINYIITAHPDVGYHIQKDSLSEEYKSNGNPETTAAVKFLLKKSYPQRHFGGPHRWAPKMLRYIGRMMRDYAEYYYDKNCQMGL